MTSRMMPILRRLFYVLRPSGLRSSPASGGAPAVKGERVRALFDLLSSMFTPDELQRFIALLPDGSMLLSDLPSGTSAAASVMEVVKVLERYGWIDQQLFAELSVARPRRSGEIDQVAAMFLPHCRLRRQAGIRRAPPMPPP